MIEPPSNEYDARNTALVPLLQSDVASRDNRQIAEGLLYPWPATGAQGASASDPRPPTSVSVTNSAAATPISDAVDSPPASGDSRSSVAGGGAQFDRRMSGMSGGGFTPPAFANGGSTLSNMVNATLGGGSVAPFALSFGGVAASGPITLSSTSDALIASPSPLTFAPLIATSVTNAAITTLSLAQLNGVINGLDPLLLLLEKSLEGKVFAQSLPLIGSQLGTLFADGVAALLKFQTFQTKIAAALTGLQQTSNVTAQSVQNAINGAISAAGFGNPAQVTQDPSTGAVSLTIDSTDNNLQFSAPLDAHFGLPGLSLDTTGTATATLGYSVDVGATIDTSGNFALTQSTSPALAVSVGVAAPNFSADANLGFVQVAASDPNNDTNLSGSFAVDSEGDATFSGDANLDLHVAADMSTAVLPSFSADIQGGWSFAAAATGGDISAFGDVPTIGINNVTFDMGSVVNNFLKPILDMLEPILKPLQTALGVFNIDLTSLFKSILGNNWTKLDVAGAVDSSGNDIPDGKITLLDFIKEATGQNLGQFESFLSEVNQLVQYTSVLDSVSAPSVLLNMGSFTVPGDIRDPSFNISQSTPQGTQSDQATQQELQTQIATYNNVGNTGTTPSVANILTNLLTTPLFSFPILTDPTSAFQMLFGGTNDLFTSTLPPASFNFGSLDANGVVTSTDNLFNLDMVPGINLSVDAAMRLAAGLEIGMDTSSLQAFAKSGFTNPLLIGNGLFFEDPTVDGVTQNLLSLAGDIQLNVEANAVVASIGGGGDIGGTLAVAFAQPGKNYLYQILNEVKSNIWAPFDVSGRVTDGFEAVAKVLGFTVGSWSSPRTTLLSFNSTNASTLPSRTTWIGPNNGAFEVAGNWTPAFGVTKLAGATVDYYGDSTIVANSTVAFAPTLEAQLTSLTLAAGAELDITSNTLLVDGTSADSSNAGLIAIDKTGQWRYIDCHGQRRGLGRCRC